MTLPIDALIGVRDVILLPARVLGVPLCLLISTILFSISYFLYKKKNTTEWVTENERYLQPLFCKTCHHAVIQKRAGDELYSHCPHCEQNMEGNTISFKDLLKASHEECECNVTRK